ncbi:hypothetical protein [Modicisalibacter radicis]|uniref:hypothetical protein n=1 Tax=Halomonas sp. EAR18 TaxID=2518972 RepID=UPI001B34CA08|nr:hypothetical protein [Halomonas sp. EAR18]
MTITKQAELDGLKEIDRIVADTMRAMANSMEPGMTAWERGELANRTPSRSARAMTP